MTDDLPDGANVEFSGWEATTSRDGRYAVGSGFLEVDGTLYYLTIHPDGISIAPGHDPLPEVDGRYPDWYVFPGGRKHHVVHANGNLYLDSEEVEFPPTPPGYNAGEFDNLRYDYDPETDTHALVVDGELVSGQAEPFDGFVEYLTDSLRGGDDDAE